MLTSRKRFGLLRAGPSSPVRLRHTLFSRVAGAKSSLHLSLVYSRQPKFEAVEEDLLADDATQIDTITYVGDPSPAQQFLRITEVNYNPYAAMTTFGELNVAADEFEFIELMNTSGTETLDLTGVKFASGLTFDFTGSAVTSLAPGDQVLVVKNLSAFESRYGTGLNIAGTFTLGSLSNNGEELKLDDRTVYVQRRRPLAGSGRWQGRHARCHRSEWRSD